MFLDKTGGFDKNNPHKSFYFTKKMPTRCHFVTYKQKLANGSVNSSNSKKNLISKSNCFIEKCFVYVFPCNKITIQ